MFSNQSLIDQEVSKKWCGNVCVADVKRVLFGLMLSHCNAGQCDDCRHRIFSHLFLYFRLFIVEFIDRPSIDLMGFLFAVSRFDVSFVSLICARRRYRLMRLIYFAFCVNTLLSLFLSQNVRRPLISSICLCWPTSFIS